MKAKSLLFALVILLGISSCTRRINCPTYSNQDLHKEVKVDNDCEV